jgi:HSP20 family protein
MEVFESYFNSLSNSFFNDNFPSRVFGFKTTNYPNINIHRGDKEYLIEVEVPGMDKDDIEVSISDDDLLSISGEKRIKRDEKEFSMVSQESFFGKFRRVISLPKDIDSSKISVKYENGILLISVKRDDKGSKSRVIPIR